MESPNSASLQGEDQETSDPLKEFQAGIRHPPPWCKLVPAVFGCLRSTRWQGNHSPVFITPAFKRNLHLDGNSSPVLPRWLNSQPITRFNASASTFCVCLRSSVANGFSQCHFCLRMSMPQVSAISVGSGMSNCMTIWPPLCSSTAMTSLRTGGLVPSLCLVKWPYRTVLTSISEG